MTTTGTTRSRLTLGMAGVVIVGSLLGALRMKRAADAQATGDHAASPDPVPQVEVIRISAEPIPIVFEVRGFLSGFEEVTVHAETTGRIVRRPVEDGRRVEAGVVLYEIDETMYRLAVRKAEAGLVVADSRRREAASALDVAKAQQNDAQAARDNAAAEFERISGLYRERESAKIEYERYETALRRAEAQVRSAGAATERAGQALQAAEASVSVADAALAEARETLSRCVVRSPISGTVDRTQYEVGEYVVAGRPLVELIRLDRMKLTVEVSGPEVNTLDEQSRADVSVDAVPGTVYGAKFSHVAPKADAVSRKFRVEFHLDNADSRLRAGMFARVRVASRSRADAITAPRSAFFRQFGAMFCFVVVGEIDDDPRVELRRVSLEDIPGRIEQVGVTGGLVPGERVVIRRPRGLRDGMSVQIAE